LSFHIFGFALIIAGVWVAARSSSSTQTDIRAIID